MQLSSRKHSGFAPPTLVDGIVHCVVAEVDGESARDLAVVLAAELLALPSGLSPAAVPEVQQR